MDVAVVSTTKKDRCKIAMLKFFGPHTSKLVDSMTEEECISKCRIKVVGFLGEEKAKIFDSIIANEG